MTLALPPPYFWANNCILQKVKGASTWRPWTREILTCRRRSRAMWPNWMLPLLRRNWIVSRVWSTLALRPSTDCWMNSGDKICFHAIHHCVCILKVLIVQFCWLSNWRSYCGCWGKAVKWEKGGFDASDRYTVYNGLLLCANCYFIYDNWQLGVNDDGYLVKWVKGIGWVTDTAVNVYSDPSDKKSNPKNPLSILPKWRYDRFVSKRDKTSTIL